MNSPRHSFALAASKTVMSFVMTVAAMPAISASVSYQATDLVDTTPGQDLWQLDYTVSGPVAQFNVVNLLFTPGSFSDVSVVSNSASASLDAAPVIQPDTGLGADGILALTALSNLNPDFKGTVGVTLVWSHAGAPGAQPFELQDDAFNVISTGQTTLTSAVPEPALLSMLLAGLAVVSATAVRRR